VVLRLLKVSFQLRDVPVLFSVRRISLEVGLLHAKLIHAVFSVSPEVGGLVGGIGHLSVVLVVHSLDPLHVEMNSLIE